MIMRPNSPEKQECNKPGLRGSYADAVYLCKALDSTIRGGGVDRTDHIRRIVNVLAESSRLWTTVHKRSFEEKHRSDN